MIRMPAIPAMELPAVLPALMGGTENKNLLTFKTSRLEVWFDEEVEWSRDGEYGGSHRHLVIENIPKALPIIIPEESAMADEEAVQREAEMTESLRSLGI